MGMPASPMDKDSSPAMGGADAKGMEKMPQMGGMSKMGGIICATRSPTGTTSRGWDITSTIDTGGLL